MSLDYALIFDFGNVVAHFDYAIAGDHFGRAQGLDGGEFIRRARESGFVDLLKVYESGGMTSEEFHCRFNEMTGHRGGFDDFEAGWSGIFRANEPVHHLIEGLDRAGYTLVLGSNTNELHARRFREQFADILRCFDALVLSHEVGRVKPAAEFYLACAESAGRPPGECVFIDDLGENVEGARRAGLVGVLFEDVAGLTMTLEGMGIRARD